MTFPLASVDAAIIQTFGQTVTYTPNGGGATSITAYFQNPNEAPDSGELEFELQGPRVHVLRTDVPTPDHLDEFIIDSVTYRVSQILEDEGTIIELMLERL